MYYGKSIKEARLKLGIYQKDIANENLSKNLLSNIEKNKTNLTPQKGIMIYKRILEVSLDKQIYVEIEFDKLLHDNEEYNQLNKTYAIAWDLIRVIQLDAHIDIIKSESILEYLKATRNGLLTYYAIYLTAIALDKIYTKERTEIMCYALDRIKVMNMDDVLHVYEKHLAENVNMLYIEGKFDKLIDFYEELLIAQKQLKNIVEGNTYYNLALFNSLVANHSKSLMYYELYEESVTDMSIDAKLDLINNRAIIYAETGFIRKAIDLYEIGAIKAKEDSLKLQESLFLSNIIYYIAKNKLEDTNDLFKLSLLRLNSVYNEILDKKISKNSLFLNLAVGHHYNNDLEMANYFFELAYLDASNEGRKVIILSDLYDFLKESNKLELISNRLDLINKEVLTRNELEKYYQLHIKLLQNKSEGK